MSNICHIKANIHDLGKLGRSLLEKKISDSFLVLFQPLIRVPVWRPWVYVKLVEIKQNGFMLIHAVGKILVEVGVKGVTLD